MTASLWDVFMASGSRASAALDDGVAGLRPDDIATGAARARLDELAYLAFTLAGQSMLVGIEALGKLALACERCLDLMRDGAIPPEHGLPILAASTHTLRRTLDGLGAADRSGALVDPLPLEAARYELETLFPVPGAPAPAAQAPDVPISRLTRKRDAEDAPDAPHSADSAGPPLAPPGPVWVPSVADDMVELFFDEAAERIEDLSLKLIDVEQRPGDSELLRDVFRDLHTLKGSSAMVGLQPMNELAHAAEDLVGQLRDGQRPVDGAIIDALLAALDGLRDIAALARERQPLALDLAPIIRQLRDPHAPGPAPAPASATATRATPAPAPADPRPPADAPQPPAAARQTIRVDFDKLDRLMNLVGELVLGRDRLHDALQSLAAMAGDLSSDRQLTRRLLGARRLLDLGRASRRPPGAGSDRGKGDDAIEALRDELGRIERVLVEIAQDLDEATGRLDSVSDDLRDQVMKLRMIPVGGVLRKHHRTVRDLAAALGKRVRLELAGEDTELDKLLVEALDEPLMHLVRNAVDHGIESPEARLAAGKSAEGTVRLRASHLGNQVIIRVADDGKGIDAHALGRRARERGLVTDDELAAMDERQLLELIFRPGLSTAATVSQVSGRGVGMDVVKQAIITQLKGTIDIDSAPGRGTAFTLRLPLTLAIIQVLLARAGGEVFAIPLDNVARTISCPADSVQRVQEREVLAVRGRQVPLIRLTAVLELEPDPYAAHDMVHVVLTGHGADTYGLLCDQLLGKKEIVIKSLGDLLRNVPCAAGATLLGDRCALILDVPAVIRRALRRGLDRAPGPRAAGASPGGAAGAQAPSTDPARAPHILLVEDSDTVRESLRRLLSDAGYQCTVAGDGVEGLRAAEAHAFDLVSTDVMMPRMDGYELTRALRAMPAYKDTPIVMVTSRGERIDRVRGFDAGVDEYITKPHDRQQLLRAVRKLLADRAGPPGPRDRGGNP